MNAWLQKICGDKASYDNLIVYLKKTGIPVDHEHDGNHVFIIVSDPGNITWIVNVIKYNTVNKLYK